MPVPWRHGAMITAGDAAANETSSDRSPSVSRGRSAGKIRASAGLLAETQVTACSRAAFKSEPISTKAQAPADLAAWRTVWLRDTTTTCPTCRASFIVLSRRWRLRLIR